MRPGVPAPVSRAPVAGEADHEANKRKKLSKKERRQLKREEKRQREQRERERELKEKRWALEAEKGPLKPPPPPGFGGSDATEQGAADKGTAVVESKMEEAEQGDAMDEVDEDGGVDVEEEDRILSSGKVAPLKKKKLQRPGSRAKVGFVSFCGCRFDVCFLKHGAPVHMCFRMYACVVSCPWSKRRAPILSNSRMCMRQPEGFVRPIADVWRCWSVCVCPLLEEGVFPHRNGICSICSLLIFFFWMVTVLAQEAPASSANDAFLQYMKEEMDLSDSDLEAEVEESNLPSHPDPSTSTSSEVGPDEMGGDVGPKLPPGFKKKQGRGGISGGSSSSSASSAMVCAHAYCSQVLDAESAVWSVLAVPAFMIVSACVPADQCD